MCWSRVGLTWQYAALLRTANLPHFGARVWLERKRVVLRTQRGVVVVVLLTKGGWERIEAVRDMRMRRAWHGPRRPARRGSMRTRAHTTTGERERERERGGGKRARARAAPSHLERAQHQLPDRPAPDGASQLQQREPVDDYS
eukprot:7380493-Prymnesium_polylepis.1